jgi:formylglycine-generating enzyme required for sulfatase activity
MKFARAHTAAQMRQGSMRFIYRTPRDRQAYKHTRGGSYTTSHWFAHNPALDWDSPDYTHQIVSFRLIWGAR